MSLPMVVLQGVLSQLLYTTLLVKMRDRLVVFLFTLCRPAVIDLLFSPFAMSNVVGQSV